jgi:hypothetical protein
MRVLSRSKKAAPRPMRQGYGRGAAARTTGT